MPATLELLAIALVFAGIALYQSRRHRLADTAQPTPLRATKAPAGARRVGALVRDGHVGDAELGAPTRAISRIAPADQTSTALEVNRADGSSYTTVNVGQVVMARAWSRGHLVLAFGETRREYGPAWAVGPGMAGWEIHLVDAAGGVMRCYGGPGMAVDADLDRLRTRLQAVALSHAS